MFKLYYCICIFLPLQSAKYVHRLRQSQRVCVKVCFATRVFDFWILCNQFSISTLFHFDTRDHKGCVCIGILSIWLNQQEQIIKRAGGGKTVVVLFFRFISSIVARQTHATSSSTANSGKIFDRRSIDTKSMEEEEGRGGTDHRFVSNRFGQNVSPISRFASV